MCVIKCIFVFFFVFVYVRELSWKLLSLLSANVWIVLLYVKWFQAFCYNLRSSLVVFTCFIYFFWYFLICGCVLFCVWVFSMHILTLVFIFCSAFLYFVSYLAEWSLALYRHLSYFSLQLIMLLNNTLSCLFFCEDVCYCFFALYLCNMAGYFVIFFSQI